MKKKVITGFAAIALLIYSTYFISCKKNVSNDVTKLEQIKASPKLFAKLSTKEQANVLAADEDWKTIVDLNTMFVDKVVNSKQNFDNVSLKDEDKVLEIIGMNRTEYMERVSKAKAATIRLLKRYNLNNSLNKTCTSCGIQKNESDLADFKKTIQYFKQNRNAYFQEKQSILATFTIAQSDSAPPVIPGDSPCCGTDFYICVSICAATIEAFPVYLGCCYLCFKSYCCKSSAPTPA